MQRAAVYRYGNDSPFGASSSTGLRQALRLQLEVTLKYHCIIAGSSSTEFTPSEANVFSNDKQYATPSALAIDYRRGFLTPLQPSDYFTEFTLSTFASVSAHCANVFTMTSETL